eukprot:gene8529-biopygen2739
MNSLMLLVAKILGVKSEGADSDVFALMEGAMNVMGIHNLLPQSARRVDIAEVATELLSGDQILIRTAGSKQRFHHGIFVGPISGVQGGKNLVVDCCGSQDAGKQEAKIRLRTLGEFMAVPGWPELAPLVDVEEVQKDEYGNVVFDADGSLVYTIVTTTQSPSVVDPDTGETRPGEPLETPIPVTEPA